MIEASHGDSFFPPRTLSNTIFSGQGSSRSVALSPSTATNAISSEPQWGRSSAENVIVLRCIGNAAWLDGGFSSGSRIIASVLGGDLRIACSRQFIDPSTDRGRQQPDFVGPIICRAKRVRDLLIAQVR